MHHGILRASREGGAERASNGDVARPNAWHGIPKLGINSKHVLAAFILYCHATFVDENKLRGENKNGAHASYGSRWFIYLVDTVGVEFNSWCRIYIRLARQQQVSLFVFKHKTY